MSLHGPKINLLEVASQVVRADMVVPMNYRRTAMWERCAPTVDQTFSESQWPRSRRQIYARGRIHAIRKMSRKMSAILKSLYR